MEKYANTILMLHFKKIEKSTPTEVMVYIIIINMAASHIKYVLRNFPCNLQSVYYVLSLIVMALLEDL